jgi:hypothetical protein
VLTNQFFNIYAQYPTAQVTDFTYGVVNGIPNYVHTGGKQNKNKTKKRSRKSNKKRFSRKLNKKRFLRKSNKK